MKESALYRPVAEFLEERCGCDPKTTWFAGCGRPLSFPSGFGKRKRKADVVGFRQHEGTKEVHLVEGKLLRVPAHDFEEARNQLDNVRAYADRLWAVFPEAEWQADAAKHDAWKRELRERAYGILLAVIKNKQVKEVRLELEAKANPHVDSARRNELLEAVFGEQDEPVEVPSLGTQMGKAAARAAARVVELMVGPVKEVFAPKGREGPFLATYYYNSENESFLLGRFEEGDLYVQGDPFGNTLDDGRPVIWVWRSLGDLKTNESAIVNAASKEHPEDTFFYVESEEDADCCPISELDIERLKAKGFIYEFSLGRAIPVDGRTEAAVKKNVERLRSWAKQIGGKG